VSRETLRKWMTKASLWCPRAQRVKTINIGGSGVPVSGRAGNAEEMRLAGIDNLAA
jgi:hypothetical protein